MGAVGRAKLLTGSIDGGSCLGSISISSFLSDWFISLGRLREVKRELLGEVALLVKSSLHKDMQGQNLQQRHKQQRNTTKQRQPAIRPNLK